MRSGDFELLPAIVGVEPIATGKSIRDRKRLIRSYGPGRRRKMKGWANVRLLDGSVVLGELHWYGAHGVGRFEMKLKQWSALR